MALSDIVRAGIAVAKTVTASFQATVTHRAWTDVDSHAQPVFNGGGSGTPRQALVELNPTLLSTTTGQEIKAKARVTFLEPVPPNGATGRKEPIDPRDLIVLPDGTTGPITFPEGMVDPSTNRPFMSEVVIG